MASTRHIPLRAAGPTVRDAMLHAPRTLAADTPADEARRAFANPRVRLLLVVDDERFVGTVTPDDVGDGAGTLADLARGDAPRVAPDDPVDRALEVLEAVGGERLPVVDDEGRLCGLVCFDRDGGQFCVDAQRV
jgi:CBS domain-containing protein